jgi:hypothetical protein
MFVPEPSNYEEVYTSYATREQEAEWERERIERERERIERERQERTERRERREREREEREQREREERERRERERQEREQREREAREAELCRQIDEAARICAENDEIRKAEELKRANEQFNYQ